jgi:hypothetical protein
MAWEINGELILEGRMVIGSVVTSLTETRVEIGQHTYAAKTRDEAIGFLRGVESARGQVKAVMAQLHMVIVAHGGKVRVPRAVVANFNAATAMIETHTDAEGDYVYEAGNVQAD